MNAIWEVNRNVLTPIADQKGVLLELEPAGVVGILPTRYAIGDDGSRTPDVDGVGRFKVQDSSGIKGRDPQKLSLKGKGAGAHYTLRTLRGGYLYVFTRKKDNTQQGWAVFEVDPGFPAKRQWEQIKPPRTPVLKPLPIPGAGPGKHGGTDKDPILLAAVACTPAGLLLINDDVDAWLCFSDALWTPRTMRKAQQDDAFRNRHMRGFDPKGWENGWARADHMAVLGEKGTRATAPIQSNRPPVAELAPRMDPKAFWFSKSPFRWSESDWVQEQRLETASNGQQVALNRQVRSKESPDWMTLKELKMIPKPQDGREGFQAKDVDGWAVLALEDPAGILMDLGSMMQKRYDAWISEAEPACPGKSIGWIMRSSYAIEGIKNALAEQAETAVYDGDIVHQDALKAPNPYLPPDMRQVADQSRDETLAHERMTQLNRVTQARSTSWDKYTKHYDVEKHGSWVKAFPDRLKTFDREKILPLANLFVSWAESARLKAYFDGVFDSRDAGSGCDFSATLAKCYASTQDKAPVHAHMAKWMKADLDEKNLLGRACILNQKCTVEEITKAAKEQINVGGLAWDGLIGGFKSGVENALAKTPNALTNWTQATLGPVAEMILGNMDDHALRPVLIAMCVGSGAPMVTIEETGNREGFLAKLTDHLYSADGNTATWGELKRASDQRMRRLKIRGVRVKGSVKYRYKLLVDPDEVRHLKGLSPGKQTEYLVSLARTEQQAQAIQRINIGKNAAVFGTLSAMVQFANMSSLAKSLEGAMIQENSDLIWRYRAGNVALAGTCIETIGKIMDGVAARGGRYASRFARAAEVSIWIGERACAAAGLVMAGLDAARSWEEFTKNNYGLGAAYLISAGATFGAALFFYFAAKVAWFGPAGFICAMVAIAVGLFIEIYKNNKIQDWLDRCCWGKLTAERYGNLVLEMRQLDLATGG